MTSPSKKRAIRCSHCIWKLRIPALKEQASSCSQGVLHRYDELVLIHGLLQERDGAVLDGAGFSHLRVLRSDDDDRDVTQGRIGFESLQDYQAIPAGKTPNTDIAWSASAAKTV